MCPFCRTEAPLVYRGVFPYCTACNHLRPPLSGPSVNMAGKPSKVGGSVARAFGWIVLALGLALAVFLGGLAALIFTGPTGLVVGIPLAIVAVTLCIVLVRSGRDLRRSGDQTERATRVQGIHALATTHGGVLTAWQVAQALRMHPAEADALLTELAKQEPDTVGVDVDDEGVILYRFAHAAPHVRVADPFVAGRRAGTRVDPGSAERRASVPHEVEDFAASPSARASRPLG